MFKAGVDFSGISNWLALLGRNGAFNHLYDTRVDWKQVTATAFSSSPVADLAKWKSPVLLVHGDDDRNVPFDQTVQLAYLLEAQNTVFKELVIPNEVHDFLRWENSLEADKALVQFFSKELGVVK